MRKVLVPSRPQYGRLVPTERRRVLVQLDIRWSAGSGREHAQVTGEPEFA